MAYTLEESTLAGAPPEAVWRLLQDPNGWRVWWPACLEVEAKDRRPLHDGSELRLVVKPSWIAIRFQARVEVATPPRALIWLALGAGLSARHAFYLEARPSGTLVRQRQDLSGWGLLPFRLLRLDVATRRMFRDSLKGLKRLAERSL
jgi:uncharacterized protein YndB with AHSA1/START domain